MTLRLKALSIWCIWFGYLFLLSLGAVREYKFNVEEIAHKPDCVEHVVIGINGEFPGPTIQAEVGDILHIAVTNKLCKVGTAIHWHGIRQYGTPWADGTPSISQCAIKPGQTFHYRFKVDKPGTYLYHGHYGSQRSAGLYGSLIVNLPKGKKEPFCYDGEFNLLLSDWWHQSSHDQEIGLTTKPFKWVGEPETLLINGRGQYKCSLAPSLANSTRPECKFCGNEECAPHILHVEPKKTYRIRIASTTSLASLNFAIGNHKLVVVEADGNYVQPFTVNDMDIYSGETYSVLLTTDQDPKQNYWISIGVRGREPSTPQGLTILNYKPVPDSVLPTSPPPITPRWNDFNLSKAFLNKIIGLNGTTPPPPKRYSRRVFLLNTQTLVDEVIKWSINNVSLSLPQTPYLGSIKFNIKDAFDQKRPPDNYSSNYDIFKPPLNPSTNIGNGVYMFQMNQVVDLILQNANNLAEKKSEVHPWHMHGHDFWVLGYGEGKFQPGKDDRKLNLKNPPFRNNAVLFPHGWTALRFRADNPGVWAFHCHIEPHLHMGMGVVFAEAVKKVRNIPKEALACGLTGKMFRNSSKHN